MYTNEKKKKRKKKSNVDIEISPLQKAQKSFRNLGVLYTGDDEALSLIFILYFFVFV